jgi:hypothetical protein
VKYILMIGFVGLISCFAAFGDDDAAALKLNGVGAESKNCTLVTTTKNPRTDDPPKTIPGGVPTDALTSGSLTEPVKTK